MANYKLSKLAKEDLIRIHEYGTRNFGEVRAEKYFTAFFDRFEEIARASIFIRRCILHRKWIQKMRLRSGHHLLQN
jgi:plasmid stabilization system protein ParE